MSSAVSEKSPDTPSKTSVAADIDWQDFRDHLATAEKDGKRRWIYAKKPVGKFYRWRKNVSYLLLGLLFVVPFLRINGNPLLMLNIVERRFSIFGQIFWPQDMAIFAVALLLFFMSIVVFTTAFGRLWCGWTCPHTIFQEMLFRRIEFRIDGDAQEQRALAQSPWTSAKIKKRLLKHGIYLGLSFVIANLFLSYIIGSDALLKIVADNPRSHVTGLTFMVLFTLLFYAIFARFREQACTFICPYGRLQSTVLDENSVVVAYDHKRGEKRSPLHREQPWNQRLAGGFGDCVNCRACIAVCPTGIDIRNGTQMECVNCTACIDACDIVMEKIGRPKNLIRYASLNSIERGERFHFTARMAWYSVVLIALTALLAVLIFTRSEVETTILRAPGSLFQTTANGEIQNLYTLKIVNKTSREIPLELKLENINGSLKIMGGELVVPKEQLTQASILVALKPSELKSGKTALRIGVYSNHKKIETVDTAFIGPRDH